MKEEFLECAEVAGKQIKSLRIFKDTGEGTEVQIEFEDGTSFACRFHVTPTIEASIIRSGVGFPESLHKYDLG